MGKIKVYQDQAGEYRWALYNRNGLTIADSGEGYYTRSNARKAARRFRLVAATAFIFNG